MTPECRSRSRSQYAEIALVPRTTSPVKTCRSPVCHSPISGSSSSENSKLGSASAL